VRVQELYGEKFNNIAYFVTKHLKAAADPACDHWHDGAPTRRIHLPVASIIILFCTDAGVYTQHSGFSLEFEQAMQVIG
jgi:hypothetical protein